MKIFFQFFLLLTFFGCSSTPETQQEFVERFTTAVKNNDNAALEACFIRSKSDIRKMVEIQNGASGRTVKVPDEQIDRMHKAVSEDLPRMQRKVYTRTTKDWDKMTFVSIEKSDKTFMDKLNLPNGTRATQIIANYKSGEEPFKIQFKLIDIGNGKWQMMDYPRKRQ